MLPSRTKECWAKADEHPAGQHVRDLSPGTAHDTICDFHDGDKNKVDGVSGVPERKDFGGASKSTSSEY